MLQYINEMLQYKNNKRSREYEWRYKFRNYKPLNKFFGETKRAKERKSARDVFISSASLSQKRRRLCPFERSFLGNGETCFSNLSTALILTTQTEDTYFFLCAVLAVYIYTYTHAHTHNNNPRAFLYSPFLLSVE